MRVGTGAPPANHMRTQSLRRKGRLRGQRVTVGAARTVATAQGLQGQPPCGAGRGRRGGRFQGRHSTCSNVPAAGSGAGRLVPREYGRVPALELRLRPEDHAQRGRDSRLVRRSGTGERALQASTSPATHTHLPPPPAPHTVPSSRRGEDTPDAQGKGRGCGGGPPGAGSHLGGLPVGKGVRAPPAKQVQQHRGRPASAPGGVPDLVTNERGWG